LNKQLISVIVPVYKVEKYLEKCVCSILGQTYHNIEILLIDDGSPDNCGKMCDELSVSSDSRIHVIHKENGGLSDARNRGIEEAKGNWLAFVDSDDYIAPDMYERLLKAALVNDSQMAVTGISYIHEISKEEVSFELPVQTLTNREAIEYFLRSKNDNEYMCNKIFQKELFEDVRFPLGKWYEDICIMPLLLHKCKNVTMIDGKGYYYLQRESGITQSPDIVKQMDGIYAKMQKIQFLKEHYPEFIPYSKRELLELCKFMLQLINQFGWDKYKKQRKELLFIYRQNMKETYYMSILDYLFLPMAGIFPKVYVELILFSKYLRRKK